MYVQYVCACVLKEKKMYVHFILSFKTDCNFHFRLNNETCFKLWTFKIMLLVCVHFEEEKKKTTTTTNCLMI